MSPSFTSTFAVANTAANLPASDTCDTHCQSIMTMQAGTSDWWNLGGSVLDTSSFPPRWECGTWTETLGWLHIISDLGIWSAYMAIPVILIFFLRRGDMAMPRVFWLFVAFIMACGLGHLVEASIFWWPVYRLSGLVKGITAIASWATVIAMAPHIKRALTWPALESANAELRLEMKHRQKAERELELANHALEHHNRELEQMVYTVSHDLKSPLVTIRGVLDFMLNDMKNDRPDRIRDFTERMDRASATMHRYLDDLLSYSKTGVTPKDFSPTDVIQTVQDVIKEMQDQIQDSGIKIHVDGSIPRVMTHAAHFRRAIQNLIKNAITHANTANEPQMVISGQPQEDGVCLSFSDNGPGITDEDHKKIFDLFYKANERSDGTGIGLTVVKRFAETHGGRVWVEPSDMGGACFKIWLPDRSPLP